MKEERNEGRLDEIAGFEKQNPGTKGVNALPWDFKKKKEIRPK